MEQLGAREWFIMSTKGASHPSTDALLYMWKHLPPVPTQPAPVPHAHAASTCCQRRRRTGVPSLRACREAPHSSRRGREAAGSRPSASRAVSALGRLGRWPRAGDWRPKAAAKTSRKAPRPSALERGFASNWVVAAGNLERTRALAHRKGGGSAQPSCSRQAELNLLVGGESVTSCKCLGRKGLPSQLGSGPTALDGARWYERGRRHTGQDTPVHPAYSSQTKLTVKIIQSH